MINLLHPSLLYCSLRHQIYSLQADCATRILRIYSYTYKPYPQPRLTYSVVFFKPFESFIILKLTFRARDIWKIQQHTLYKRRMKLTFIISRLKLRFPVTQKYMVIIICNIIGLTSNVFPSNVWLEYCRYGVNLQTINQSIITYFPVEVGQPSDLHEWNKDCFTLIFIISNRIIFK